MFMALLRWCVQAANLPAVKLLAVKKKLVAESARMGKVSHRQVCALGAARGCLLQLDPAIPQAYEISNLDKDT